MARLSNGIDAHSRTAALDPANWGYAGDLAEVCERLVQGLASIDALSAEEMELHGI